MKTICAHFFCVVLKPHPLEDTQDETHTHMRVDLYDKIKIKLLSSFLTEKHIFMLQWNTSHLANECFRT